MSVYIHIYTTIQHTLHLLSMLYNTCGLQSWTPEDWQLAEPDTEAFLWPTPS